jgi:hypothetical protein
MIGKIVQLIEAIAQYEHHDIDALVNHVQTSNSVHCFKIVHEDILPCIN